MARKKGPAPPAGVQIENSQIKARNIAGRDTFEVHGDLHVHGWAAAAPETEALPSTTVPPLPSNFLVRAGTVNALVDALLQEQKGSSGTIALTSVAGMGGIGKTVLAQALCHDARVQAAFPDGIIWQSIGKESAYKISARLRAVRLALHDSQGNGNEQDRFRLAIRDKAALLVIDDVWNVADIEPWLADSPRSRVLFTTRDASIAAGVGAQQHWAELLSEAESRKALAQWSGWEEDKLPAESGEIIGECGRLPLALAMVGAMLRGKPAALWTHTLNILHSADLAKIKAQFPGSPYPNLFAAIQASVDSLEPADRERYLALAVLVEEMSAARVVQQTLWGTNVDEATETAERFISLSLAQRDADGESIRLHDLQLDYVCALYPSCDALRLIHGAVRLSSHVILKDPAQFASQVVSRLLVYQNDAAVQKFTNSLRDRAPRPWLAARWPALEPPGGALIRTLQGHSGPVYGVALSVDGRHAVSASRDNTLKVWDVDSGRELLTLQGHFASVNGVALSADGRRAVSASGDNTLKVWDVDTGRELLTLQGHSASVTGVALSAHGRHAVSASDDKTLKVWDVDSGREILTLHGHSASVNGVALSADGRRAVSASDDYTLKVWDVDSGRELLTLHGHSASVNGVALTADGRHAVSASDDYSLKVWDVDSGRELLTLHGHSDSVNGVALSADGRRAVSASNDDTLKVWDVDSGRELLTLHGHSASVYGVALSADGRRAVSASWENTVKVWDLNSGRELPILHGHSASVSGVALSADGRRAVSTSWDDTLKVWDVDSGHEILTLRGHSDSVYGVALSADGRHAVSASGDKTLKVWDVDSGHEILTLRGHSDSVNGVALSADGRRAVSTSRDKTLKVWDVDSGRELLTLHGHSDSVYGVALSADCGCAVSASSDKTLKVWDVDSGRELLALHGHSDSVYGVALSADGKRAVSASDDETLKVWDVDRGRERLTLRGHSSSVYGVALSADGRRAISASDDYTLKAWDVDAGKASATFTGDAPFLCCALSDSDPIVAGDIAGRVYVLELIE